MNKMNRAVLLLGTIFSVAGSFLITTSKPSNTLKNVKSANFANSSLASEPADFSSFTELERTDLRVSLSSASTTSTSYSFSLNISSSLTTVFKSRYNNYWAAIDDPAYSDNLSDYTYDNDEDIPEILPEFNGYLYEIYYDGQNPEVYIPSKLTRNGSFVINLTYIPSEAWVYDELTLSKNRTTEIHIPETIERIDENAFINVPDSVEIFCQAPSKPEGWDDNWTDATTIHWGEEDFPSKYINQTVSGNSTVGEAENYIVGFFGTGDYSGDEYQLPLSFQYELTHVDGTKETKVYELPKKIRNGMYDGVGDFLSKTYSNNVDIEIKPGETIDTDEIYIFNIYKAVKPEGKTWGPDLSTPYYSRAAQGYSSVYDLSNFASFRYDSTASFAGNSVFKVKVDKASSEIYQSLMPNSYNTNLSKIESGEVYVRCSIQNIFQTEYRVIFRNSNGELQTEKRKFDTPINFQILNKQKGNTVSFMFKNSDIAPDFKASNVVFFEIIGITIQLDLYTPDTGSVNLSSIYTNRFGRLTVYENENGTKVTSVDSLYLIIFAAYSLLFAVLATAYFFFAKNKFKNDEFRRVNNKKFVKKALILFAGSTEVLMAIISIIFRWSVFRSTIVVFNPLDICVVAFTLVGIIITGYGIKVLIDLIKASKQRKTAIKLKLNEDAVNDGTK